jgi:hypothetical protein
MIIIVTKYLIPKGFRGLTLFPFVFIKAKTMRKDEVLLNHERIHLKQQLELLVVFFYVWYGIEFLWRWMQYRNGYLAYANVSFEKEAYANEHNLYYTTQRSFWGFVKYLK